MRLAPATPFFRILPSIRRLIPPGPPITGPRRGGRLPGYTLLGLLLAAAVGSCHAGDDGHVSVQVENTLDGLAHQGPQAGMRVYESLLGLRPVKLREVVGVGEDGSASLDLIGADGRSAADFVNAGLAESWEQFRSLHRQRAAFALKYRDFRIRDASLALRNYVFAEAGEERVAERPTRRWIVRPRTPDRPTYQVDLDAETGAVLGYEERDPSGRLLGKLVYESVRGPSPTAPAERTSGSSLTSPATTGGEASGSAKDSSTSPVLPVSIREVSMDEARDSLNLPLPQALEVPGGFSLVSHEVVRLGPGPGAPSVFFSLFTDGVQPIILLARPVTGGATSPDGQAASVAAVGTDGSPLVAEVSVSRDGPLTLLQLEVLGMSVVLLGRVDREVLAAFLDAFDFAR